MSIKIGNVVCHVNEEMEGLGSGVIVGVTTTRGVNLIEKEIYHNESKREEDGDNLYYIVKWSRSLGFEPECQLVDEGSKFKVGEKVCHVENDNEGVVVSVTNDPEEPESPVVWYSVQWSDYLGLEPECQLFSLKYANSQSGE